MAVYTINHRKTIGKWQFIQFHYGLWYLYVFITFYNELVTGAILNQQTYLTGASHYGFCCHRYSTRPCKQTVCY